MKKLKLWKQMTLNKYIENDYPNSVDIEGFTIKNGKKIYWYITPTKNGFYRCIPIERDETLGWARYIDGNTEVKVIDRN